VVVQIGNVFQHFDIEEFEAVDTLSKAKAPEPEIVVDLPGEQLKGVWRHLHPGIAMDFPEGTHWKFVYGDVESVCRAVPPKGYEYKVSLVERDQGTLKILGNNRWVVYRIKI
jgi:hypothetical protein